jgi:hypothetical protein
VLETAAAETLSDGTELLNVKELIAGDQIHDLELLWWGPMAICTRRLVGVTGRHGERRQIW